MNFKHFSFHQKQCNSSILTNGPKVLHVNSNNLRLLLSFILNSDIHYTYMYSFPPCALHFKRFFGFLICFLFLFCSFRVLFLIYWFYFFLFKAVKVKMWNSKRSIARVCCNCGAQTYYLYVQLFMKLFTIRLALV